MLKSCRRRTVLCKDFASPITAIASYRICQSTCRTETSVWNSVKVSPHPFIASRARGLLIMAALQQAGWFPISFRSSYSSSRSRRSELCSAGQGEHFRTGISFHLLAVLREHMRSKRRRIVFRIIVLMVSTILSWGFAEIVILLLGINNDYRDSGASVLLPLPGGPTELSDCGHVPFATIRMRFPTNPRKYFSPENTIDHVLNSAGWRDGEHTLEKPAETFRILGLGDSYLFGQGVKPQDRCLDCLPEHLHRHWPEIRFETINTGQPGYNTVQELHSLERCGWKYSPDLVILHFVPNDIEEDIYTEKPKVEFFTEYTTSFLGTDWLSQHSEVWSLARRKILGQWKGRAYVRQSIDSFVKQPDKWENCRRPMAEIANQCQQHDVGLLVVVFPFFISLNGEYPFQPIHDRMKEFCRESKIACLDLRETFRNYNGPELWVHPVDQHPNETAHRLAAEAIADFIVANRVQLQLPRVNAK